MKTTYLLMICILICRTSMAQVEYDNRFYEEILKECFYDTKPLEEIGITGKVKNIKLYIQSVQKNRKNIMEREPRFGFYYEFDKLGRARLNFIYDTIEQVKENKSAIDKNQKNYVFFSKNGVIEREVRDGGTVTDLYDRNGNLVETVMNNAANTLTGGEDMLYDITEYTYDKNNKILRKTDYWPTRNRDSLKVEAITKNKPDESGNIVEREIISGPQKLITRYEYNDCDNPVYISNADQSITREYDENNELEKLEISSTLGEEIIKYKNKKVLSKEYTNDGRRNKSLVYIYKYDKKANWIFCGIDVAIFNKKNQTVSVNLKYEIVREIEYYRERP